jgi:hypothetical protein
LRRRRAAVVRLAKARMSVNWTLRSIRPAGDLLAGDAETG